MLWSPPVALRINNVSIVVSITSVGFWCELCVVTMFTKIVETFTTFFSNNRKTEEPQVVVYYELWNDEVYVHCADIYYVYCLYFRYKM